MRFTQRLSNLIRRAGAALLTPAEDPRKAFASSYTRQRQLLAEIQGSLAEVTELKSGLASLVVSTAARLPRLQDEARGALQQGRDDLARHMVERRLLAEDELDELTSQLAELEAEERRLVAAERRLDAQIEAFSARQQMVSARLTTTEAQARLSESLRNIGRELSELGIALEEAEGKVETMQARAGEIDKLLLRAVDEQASGRGQKEIEQRLADRNLHSRVEKEMNTLRRKRQ